MSTLSQAGASATPVLSKTVSIAVALSSTQREIFDQLCDESEWIWNYGLKVALHNHCLDWYRWAEKTHKISMDDVIRVPLRMGRNAYYGATCQIAHGGPYFVRDQSAKASIPVAGKDGATSYLKPFKRVEGDSPYTRIAIEPHQFQVAPSGKELKTLGNLDDLGALNSSREKLDLPPLTKGSSDYVGGVIKRLETAIKAWKDGKNINAKKPLFKREDNRLQTLQNLQKPPTIDGDRRTVSVAMLGNLRIRDKSALKRLANTGMLPRTYTLSRKASGYYLNISVSEENRANRKKLKNAVVSAKKTYGEGSIEHLAAQEVLAISEAKASAFGISKMGNHSAGIDPGVVAIVATDHGALFSPNKSRDRVAEGITRAQQRLAHKKSVNDAIATKIREKKRPPTANELKLKRKISRLHERSGNSSKHFNHKLSTRLARTYHSIAWEDTQLQNMTKKAAPKPDPNSSGYLPNHGNAKSGLNRSINSRSIGDLRAKTKEKLEGRGGKFILLSARNSSQTCHCCGEKGDRRTQSSFFCLNENCLMYSIEQNADINAAKNFHKQAFGEASIDE